jgi:hypothetical protein
VWSAPSTLNRDILLKPRPSEHICGRVGVQGVAVTRKITPTYTVHVYIRTTVAAEAKELNATAVCRLTKHFLGILFDAK